METRTLTILLTDIQGYTETSARLSREEQISLVRSHRDFVRPCIERFGGRVIKGIGDAFLAVFDSPTNAVLSGIALQEALRGHNVSLPPEQQTHIKVAINTGEVTLEEGDVYGEAVNITARIESLADANEVYFTEATYLAMNKAEVPSAEVGYRTLKGIREQVRVYRVLWEKPHAAPTTSQSSVTVDTAEAATLSPSEPAVVLAPHWRRAVAFLVDMIPVLVLTGVLQAEDALGLLLCFLLYQVPFLWRWGRTPGRYLMKIRVVSERDPTAQRLGFRRSALRTACYALSAFPLGSGFLWPLWDEKRQAFHDMIAKTLVIRR